MKAARGTSATFEATFVDLDGEPLVPADSATPQVQIKNPDGEVQVTAVGSPIGQGIYQFKWFVPVDAELNVPENKWFIEWFFIVLGGYTKSSEEFFDVIDKVEPTPEERKWTYISLPNKSERIFFRTEQDPFLQGGQLQLEIYNGSNQLITQISEVTQDKSQLACSDPTRKMGWTVNQGQYVYYYNTDPLTVGEYLIFWGLRETEVSQMEYEQQVIRVPHWNFWRLNKPLQMVIDKLQKRIGWVQGYSDADILEYILRGLGMVNGFRPNTDWTLATIPSSGVASSGIADAVLTAASIRALEAQQILEIELSFGHSGQTVTLDYNHDFGGVIGNLRDDLTSFAEAKERLYRAACGPGVAGVRPKRYGVNQRVYRVTDSGGDPYDPTNFISRVFTG